MKEFILDILERIELIKRYYVNPERYIPKLFYKRMGYKLNLETPKTFNEKLQWLKLYYHNPLYTTLVDKYAVKDYVQRKLGKEYIIPTIGIWHNVANIDFHNLPKKFVLKCTHDSGSYIICKDKSKLIQVKVKRTLGKCMSKNYYYMGFEWPYKDVKACIIAEPLLEDDNYEDLHDYKFFCFNGKVKCFKIDFERFVNHRANYYDRNCKLLPFGERVCPPIFQRDLHIPATIEKMIEMAEVLSKNMPFVRVDFYDVNGRIYFGEMTFFPSSGFGKFTEEEWDLTLGSWIKLPNKMI